MKGIIRNEGWFLIISLVRLVFIEVDYFYPETATSPIHGDVATY